MCSLSGKLFPGFCSQGTGAETSPEDFPQKLEVTVPELYQDLADVFDKRGAETLPPHWPYDCPVDLHPSAEIPFG